jgi:transcription initiation factor TFIID subunit 7
MAGDTPARPGLLKLKIGKSTQNFGRKETAPATPASASGSGVKLKLNFGLGGTPTEPTAKAKKEKKEKSITLKPPKPARKKAEKIPSKKRKADADPEAEAEKKMVKKIKFKTNVTEPATVANFKIVSKRSKTAKHPQRELGVGYDSEASDREDDPAIEEQFILRMQPGDDCDYLRKAIEEKKIGLKLADGGVEVWMRFFDKGGRRGFINIRGKFYAASMMNLPCIIEGMKSWDKRGWWKSADICKILVVSGEVASEEAAEQISVSHNVDFPHGLTPPMFNARKRRFKKRISNRTIEEVEAEVDRLIEEDQACAARGGVVNHDLVDLDRLTRERDTTTDADSDEEEEEEEEEEDVEGLFGNGMDYSQGDVEMDAEGEDDDDAENDLEADLEAAMAEGAVEDDSEPMTGIETRAASAMPDMLSAESALNTPGASGVSAGEDDDDESDEDEDDDIDEDEVERQEAVKAQQAEIDDLEAEIKAKVVEMQKQKNALLKEKLARMIRSLKEDLEMKKNGMGGEE